MIRFTYDGKEFEFRGLYREPLAGDTFLSSMDGQLSYQVGKWNGTGNRAIVHTVPVIHEFGGVKFVEIGEGQAHQGDWYLSESEWGNKVPGVPTYWYDVIHSVLVYKTLLKRYEE